MPIARSILAQRQVGVPLEKLPHVGRTLTLLAISTVVGGPVLLLLGVASLLDSTDGSFRLLPIGGVAAQLLLFAAALLPSITMLSVTGPTHASTNVATPPIRPLALFMTSVGAGALVFFGPTIASEIGTLGLALTAAIGLATAAGVVGQAVPGWRTLGAARQPALPMVIAILIIAAIQFGLPQASGATLLIARTVLAGTSLLLAVGAGYLLANRLWLAGRLWRALLLAGRND